MYHLSILVMPFQDQHPGGGGGIIQIGVMVHKARNTLLPSPFRGRVQMPKTKLLLADSSSSKNAPRPFLNFFCRCGSYFGVWLRRKNASTNAATSKVQGYKEHRQMARSTRRRVTELKTGLPTFAPRPSLSAKTLPGFAILKDLPGIR